MLTAVLKATALPTLLVLKFLFVYSMAAAKIGRKAISITNGIYKSFFTPQSLYTIKEVKRIKNVERIHNFSKNVG